MLRSELEIVADRAVHRARLKWGARERIESLPAQVDVAVGGVHVASLFVADRGMLGGVVMVRARDREIAAGVVELLVERRRVILPLLFAHALFLTLRPGFLKPLRLADGLVLRVLHALLHRIGLLAPRSRFGLRVFELSLERV